MKKAAAKGKAKKAKAGKKTVKDLKGKSSVKGGAMRKAGGDAIY